MATARANLTACVAPASTRAVNTVRLAARPVAAKVAGIRSQRVVTRCSLDTDLVVAKPGTDRARDENGYFKYFPPSTGSENYAALTEVGGSCQKVLVYAGGSAADQILLFPVLKQLRSKLPYAQIDVCSSEWAHYAYDICPYINKTWVYNVDGNTLPTEFLETLGDFKNEYYTAVITAKPVGLNSAAMLWMGSSTNMKGYYDTTGYAGNTIAKAMFNKAVAPPSENPLTEGTSAFTALAEMLEAEIGAKPMSMDSIEIGIPDYPQSFAVHAMEDLSLTPGAFTLVHGLASTSKAAMQMSGGSSGMSIEALKSVVSSAGQDVVVCVPREVEAEAVRGACPGAKVLMVAAPAKLAAMIALSKNVVAANTAALPLASFLGKAAVGVFETQAVADKFAFKGVENVLSSSVGTAVARL